MWSEAETYIQNKRLVEALADMQRARPGRGDDPIFIHSKGMLYAAQGKRAEALQVIKQLEQAAGPSLRYAQCIAMTYAVLNEPDLALD
jgi:Flp pilus assembly protein TadD